MERKFIAIVLFLIFFKIHAEETTTEFYTCEENTTCGTEDGNYTTEIPTTELIFFNNETNLINTTSLTKIPLEINYDSYDNKNRCLCDLLVSICDINCCCDTDCTENQKLVFVPCRKPKETTIDSLSCQSSEFTLFNQLENEIKSLFCVVKTNLPAYHYVQIEQPIISVEKAERYVRKRFKWPEGAGDNKRERFDSEMELKYGDSLWVNTTFGIVPLYIPDKFISNSCSTRKYINYLENSKTSCSQHDLHEDNLHLSASTYFENITLFSHSKNSNESEENDQKYLELRAFKCEEHFENCTELLTNDTKAKIVCRASGFGVEKTCYNLVKTIKYTFFHNGTNGLVSTAIYFQFENISWFINDNFEFIQNFEVEFLWDNQPSLNFSPVLSGNPGYLIGKPIRFGLLNDTSNQNESGINLEIIQNDFDVMKNLLVLPKNHKGACVLNNNTYSPINFGYNTRLECTRKCFFNRTDLNASSICLEIQSQIYNLWQVNTLKKYIGMYGNSNKTQISEWIEIIYKFDPSKTLEKISGYIENNHLICINLVKTLKINIIYALIDYEHVQNQAKILHINYQQKLDNQTKLYINFIENTTVDINLVMEVMFFDVTMQKVRKFIDPPSFQIRLPHDFFYPFNIGSSQSHFKYNTYLIVFCMYFLWKIKF